MPHFYCYNYDHRYLPNSRMQVSTAQKFRDAYEEARVHWNAHVSWHDHEAYASFEVKMRNRNERRFMRQLWHQNGE
jgi:sulfatase maturation enzyme AslB (radical SAM superfamily)